MELSASELTKWAKEYCKSKEWRITRMNNTPIQRRKGTIEKGWPDLIGYTQNGLIVSVEVKKKGDKLSQEQIVTLKDIYQCGGMSYICTENKDHEPILISWGEMKF